MKTERSFPVSWLRQLDELMKMHCNCLLPVLKDIAKLNVVCKHFIQTPHSITLSRVEEVTFQHPIYVHDIATLSAKILRICVDSVQIRVSVRTEQYFFAGKSVITVMCACCLYELNSKENWFSAS